MKKILIVLLLVICNYSFAQKIVGTYTSSDGCGFYQYYPSNNNLEISPVIPSLTTDTYCSFICQYNGNVYGSTYLPTKKSAIFEYNTVTNVFSIIYTYEFGGSGYMVVNKGVLYALSGDSISNYILELDINSKVFKKNYIDKSIGLDNAHHVLIAENNKIYFITEAGTINVPIYKFVEYDLNSKIATEKMISNDIPSAVFCWETMYDIGDGMLATTNTRGRFILTYDFKNNVFKKYPVLQKGNDILNNATPIIRRGKYLYYMADSWSKNKYGYLVRVDMETGEYEKIVSFKNSVEYNPIAACIMNDVIYGYDNGTNKMFAYDFVSEKEYTVIEFNNRKIRGNCGFIVVK